MAELPFVRAPRCARVFFTSCLMLAAACGDAGAGTGTDGVSWTNPGATAGGASPGTAGTTGTPAAGGSAAPTTTAGSAASGGSAAPTTTTPPANTGTMTAPGGAAGAASMSPDATPSTGGAAGAASGAAGAPAAGAPAAAAGSGGSEGGAPEQHEDLGMGDGSDVITIGDSWMSYAVNGGGIETGLLAASGQPYRTYGVAGTMLLDEVIPNQYVTAKRQNPDIKTVVMTGGGNDLLLTGMTAGGCGDGCMDTINRVTERLTELWTEMHMDGVQDVVYIEYSRGGGNAAGVGYAHMVVPQACAAAPVRCHFIDSDEIIMMELLDGVHPTASGCQKLGKAAFDLMVEKGMRR
jgi:hypothetical protein